MKGIILCAGAGRRLEPITHTVPKQLIPIANKPLLVYSIEILLKMGIDEIAIVVNEENKSTFENTLSLYFDKEFFYIIQDEPEGIAHGLLFTEDFVHEDKFILLLGDNSFDDGIEEFIKEFAHSDENCKILLKKVDNPESYGVAYIGEENIVYLEEKPKIAFSNWAITGIYGFDSNIFKACKKIKPSKRGEYEITDAINWLLNNGYNVGYSILESYWKDVGTPVDVITENAHRLSSIDEKLLGEIIESQIMGKVVLGKGTAIYNSIIRGPAVIGDNSTIKHSYVGPYTSIGKEVNIDNSIVENSIILDNSMILNVVNTMDYSIVGKGSIITNEKGLKPANRFILGENTRIYLK